jgi:hypothetical protein
VDLNQYLPVLVPAAIGLVAVSTIAMLALAWTKNAAIRSLIIRAWIAFAVLAALGVVIFWIATAMAPGSRHASIDHSLQDRQAGELRQRLKEGGH